MRPAPLGICASREAVRADLEKGTWPMSGRQSGVVKSPYLSSHVTWSSARPLRNRLALPSLCALR